MFYEPQKGHGLPHDPSKALVSPRPIGWISTHGRDGSINLAPYSFFGMLSAKPFIVWFSSDGEKDSAAFAKETGEFAVNLVTADLVEQMCASSVDAPRGVSEFDYAGLTPASCRLISAPRVAEAHAVLECRLTEVFRPRGLDGRESQNHVVMGEVVGVEIDDDYLVGGLFDTLKAGNVARLGYMDYSKVTELFQRRRPAWKDRDAG